MNGTNGNEPGYPENALVPYLAAFIAEHVHIIFQQDTFIGQRSSLVHAKHIHAAKSLHGIDVFDDGLLAAHGKTAPCKASGNNHRQHLRHQSYSHRQRKSKGFQPFPTCDTEKREYNGNQHRNKAEHDPGDGIGTLLKGFFIIRIRFCKAAVECVLSDRQHNTLAFTADDCCCHESKIFKLGQRFQAAVTEGAAALFQNGAFARYGCL